MELGGLGYLTHVINDWLEDVVNICVRFVR